MIIKINNINWIYKGMVLAHFKTSSKQLLTYEISLKAWTKF